MTILRAPSPADNILDLSAWQAEHLTNSHVWSAYSQLGPSFSPSPTEGMNWSLTIVTYQQVAVLGLGPKLVFDLSIDFTT